MKKYTLPFNRLLLQNNQFIIETESNKYNLTTGINEYYILLNLASGFQKTGRMIIGIGEQKGKEVLLPVAILKEEQRVWITVTADENTAYPDLPQPALLTPFEAEGGEEYTGGFIDAARTALTYKELMYFESYLHEADYEHDFYNAYRNRYPDCRYDARLHYFMIKGIRKHRYYVDDFNLPCDPMTFYHGWSDPFPWYLYIKTFGGTDTWPSFARMRLMAANRCIQGVPLAIKVLKNSKSNNRICHYAVLVAGLDEANNELVRSCTAKCPRAVARIWHERKSPELYPMLLENARGILDGGKEDLLDDLPETYMPNHNPYEDYTIDHRGYITLEMLTPEQLRELWDIYRQIGKACTKSRKEEDRFRLGNAFRAFMMAAIYNKTTAVTEIMQEVYNQYNTLLYSEWSQDSHFKQMDVMWSDYLYRYVKSQGTTDHFWTQLQNYAKKYDSYCLYSNQRFFLMIYSKMAYHMLPPETFYDALSRLIDSNYVLVEQVWRGVTGDTLLEKNDSNPLLDHRWENMFRNYKYYICSKKAYRYYELVKHMIQPHPTEWRISDWEKDLSGKKKIGIGIPL